MRYLIVTMAALATATLAAAQANVTAHPQDSVQSSIGNFAPFGVFSTGGGAESRTQFLVPKDELPGAGAMLLGMELCTSSSVTADYASLEVTAAATNATSLVSTFASNLNASAIVVRPPTPLQVAYSSTSWVAISFPAAYVHDGSSALVLDIRKQVQAATSYATVSMRASSNPPRSDRPSMVYSFGGPGSGQSNATSGFAAADPISFRLLWSDAPTVHVRGELGVSNNRFNIGGSLDLTMSGDAGKLWALAAGSGFLATPGPIPGITGTFRLQGAVLFAAGLLDASGEGTVPVSLPNNPNLVGLYLVYQGATVDPATGVTVLTNGTDHFINS